MLSKKERYIYDSAIELGVKNKMQIAYILATVSHETNGTFNPVEEAYWVKNKLIKKYGKKRGTTRFNNWLKKTKPMSSYYPYTGKGYVQLTWKENYIKAGRFLSKHFDANIDLIKNPSYAMIKCFAVVILIKGMQTGLFSGKKLDDYINDRKNDLYGARRIVNGKDRAKKIEIIAKRYYRKIV